MRTRRRGIARAIAVGTPLLIGVFDAHAATFTWDGGAGTNRSWNLNTNWTNDTLPTSNTATDLLFNVNTNTGTSALPLLQNIANPMVINSLTFGNGAGGFFFAGNSFNIDNGAAITQNSSNAQSIANVFTTDNNTTNQLSLTGDGTGVVTLSGAINRANGNRNIQVVKSGSSTFVLSAASDYTGGTTINDGVLRVTNASGLGGGGVTLNAGTLEISGITLTNTLAMNNGATLMGTGAASFTSSGNPVIASGATVSFRTGLAADVLSIGSGYTNAAGSSATPTINIDNPTGGRVVLASGNNSFRGNWVINSGTLQGATNGANTFGTGSASTSLVGSSVTLAGGNLEVRGTSNTTYNAGTAGNEVGMKVNASGTVAAGRTSGGAGVTHTFGALTLGNNNNVNATFTHTANVSSGTAAFTFGAVTLNGDATVTVAKPSGAVISQVNFSAIGQTGGNRSFTKSGPGLLTLSGTSTYQGTTSINNGALRLTGTLNSGGGLVTVSATTPDTATLSGTGTIQRDVTIADRGTISPGSVDFNLSNFNINQTGTTTTFDAGGTYVWNVNTLPASGTAGVNWDTLSLNALSVTATSGAKFTIKVISTNGGGTAAGTVTGVSATPGTKYTWTIATNANGITGFDLSKFALETTAFNTNDQGYWSLETNGGNLQITMTVPEPASVSMLALAGVSMLRRRATRR